MSLPIYCEHGVPWRDCLHADCVERRFQAWVEAQPAAYLEEYIRRAAAGQTI